MYYVHILGGAVFIYHMAFSREAIHLMHNNGVGGDVMKPARAEVQEEVCIYM